LLVEMAANGLRDQDRLDEASNYVIWKAKINCLLDEHNLKACVDSVVAESTDADPLKKYKVEMVKAKQLILDEVRDHIVCHIVGKGMTKEIWDALATLYQGSSEQRKMYLEEKMRSTRDAEGGTHCSVPIEASGGPRLNGNCRISTSAHRDGEVSPKFSLKRIASICPDYPGQREIVRLGRDVGRSLARRDEARLSKVQT